NYEEALEILDDVSNVEGRMFESDRQRAKSLREKALQDRTETAQRNYSEAKRMVAQQRFREAI
ncbi:MAG: hypothetical protein GTN62_01170, partial [Gemmatimonadales bacterium]|nr:hypothetical protein [Gemmatimonadales bacterium]NIP06179.1 hypothetical protein [Gemmatimonadales bacterium]